MPMRLIDYIYIYVYMLYIFDRFCYLIIRLGIRLAGYILVT